MEKIEDILDIGNRKLSPSERQFVTTLLSELEQFQYQASKDRALMFHPLGGFQRYLIHKVTLVFPRLTSFSIGDERNRRTVVCFKTKKRNRTSLEGLNVSRNEAPSRNEYVNSPQRSVDNDLSRRSTPANRSRESSRNRKKHEEPLQNKSSLRNKPESSSYLPKPLRSKKAATKRDQMKRSRSLQSSPVRNEGRDSRATDDDRLRGRSRSQSGKQPRSSSLKPPGGSKRRDRTDSPNISDVERKLRKPPIKPNVSDVSLKKRGDGLRLEGRVINGDVEDPYSCSDSDAARIDAEAIRREQDRNKKFRAKAYSSSSSEETEYSVESSEETGSEVPSHDKDEHFYVNTVDSADSEERPPSYSSLKRSASLKKAQRNLDRIKHAESHSRKTSRDEESSGEESSSEDSSQPSRKPSSSRSAPSTSKKSSTLPKITKEKAKKSAPESRKAHTLKSSGSSRKKSQETSHEARRDHGASSDKRKGPEKRKGPDMPPEGRKQHHASAEKRKETERTKKSSTSSAKGKPRGAHSAHKDNFTEEEGRKKKRSNKDDLLRYSSGKDGSDGSTSKLEGDNQVPPQEKQPKPKIQGKEVVKQPASPEEKSPLIDHPIQCEGATQTDMTGTLSRSKETSSAPEPNPENSSAKSVGDILAAMVQSLGMQSQNNQPNYQQPFNPNLNAFHQHMQNMAPPPPPANVPPLPPQLIHHIYMSWLGAYYAGATGTLPPPPPFVLPITNNPSTGTPMTPLDFLPPNFPFMHNSNAEAEKDAECSKSEDHYYNDAYPSTSHHEIPLNSENGHCSPEERNDNQFPAPHSYNDVEKSFGNSRSRHPNKVPQQQLPHRDNSPNSASQGRCSILTDSDVSSVVSSGRKKESADVSSSKPGVMVYVCSQPSSRKSSVGAVHESVESDVASSHHSSDHGNQTNRNTRVSEVKKGKQRQVKLRDRASTPHAREGEATNKSVISSTQPASSFPSHITPTHSTPSSKMPLVISPSIDINVNTSNAVQDGVADASQEEIILSLRRAPLATIEDDADELSTSLASSAASLNTDNNSEHSDKIPEKRYDQDSESENSSSSVIVEMHVVTPTPENGTKPEDFPPLPTDVISGHDPKHLEVPSIDHSSDESESDEDTPPASLPPLNGVGPSDDSSISDGDREVKASDSSYDADQSRVEDASNGRKVRHNDVSNSLHDVNDDVVVQDSKFDYYNWQPSTDEWCADEYKRFVEIFNFPAKLSDIEISSFLTKYKGLRLSRVDKTVALCTLPSEDVANELLSENFPIFSTRPLRAASEKFRKKARSKLKDAGFEKARAARPKMDPAATKRMIAASLGGKSGTSGGRKTNNESK